MLGYSISVDYENTHGYCLFIYAYGDVWFCGNYHAVVQWAKENTSCYMTEVNRGQGCEIFHPNGYVELTPAYDTLVVCIDGYCSKIYIDKNFIKNTVDVDLTESQKETRLISGLYDDQLELINPAKPRCSNLYLHLPECA